MRRKPEEPPKGAPGWMTTYGDMMTNLLAFFVLLYSFSELDVQRFQAVLASFQEHAGVLNSGQTITGKPPLENAGMLTPGDVQWHQKVDDEIYQALQQFVQEEGLEDAVEVVRIPEGSILRFSDKVLFDIGQAALLPEAKPILDKFANLAEEWPNHLRVEGHTDDWPINTSKYPSNWELSVYRASTVVRYLEDAGISSERLSAMGYGEHRPIATNDTVDGRRRNRRVDIIVTTETDPNSKGTTPSVDRLLDGSTNLQQGGTNDEGQT